MSPFVLEEKKTRKWIHNGRSGGLSQRLDSFSAPPALTMGVKSHANGAAACQHLQPGTSPGVPACLGSARILRGLRALQTATGGK